MDTIFCRSTALEILHGLRIAEIDKRHVDPCMRRVPLTLERNTEPVLVPAPPSPQNTAAFLAHVCRVQEQCSSPTETPVPKHLRHLAPITQPIHLATRRGSTRRPNDLRKLHQVSGELPPGSTITLVDGTMLTSPEQLFLDMAPGLDGLELVWLGSLLCATFSQHPTQSGPIVPAWPLTSVQSLKLHAEQALAVSTRGARKALEACRHLVEHAASPRELNFALQASLPLSKGGYALPKPEVNAAVIPDKRLSGITRRPHISCDMLWPERMLVVEYDSDLHHLDTQQRGKDNSKHDELQSLGYRVETISTAQLNSVSLTDQALRRIARALGVRNRTHDCGYDWQARRWDLRKRLAVLEDSGIPWPGI